MSAVVGRRLAVFGFAVPRGYLQWTWAIVGAAAALDMTWCTYAGMSIRNTSQPAIVAVGLLALSMIYRWRSRGLADSAQIGALWLAFTASCCVLTYLCATAMWPLQDATFAEFDRRLGFDWLSWHAFAFKHRMLHSIFSALYASLTFQILFSVLYLPATGRAKQGAELIFLATITALGCCVVSAFWPAIGYPTGFNYTPRDLLALRSPGPWEFHLFEMQGIITMPSYHTTLALLLTYSFRNTRVVGWGVATLNAVMLPSIPAIGGHYLVDMLAGSAIALLSIGIIRRARSTRLNFRNDKSSLAIRHDGRPANPSLTSTSVERSLEAGDQSHHSPGFPKQRIPTMLYAWTWLLTLRADKRGVTAMEYGLIAALIAVVIIAAVTTVGTKLSATFTNIAGALPSG